MFTLSPQARAIAFITLAFLLVTGTMDRLAGSIVLAFATGLSQRSESHAISLVVIVLGLLILVAARFTSVVTEGWAQATAQAAQVLACVGLAIAALNLLGSVLHSGPYTFFPYFPYVSP